MLENIINDQGVTEIIFQDTSNVIIERFGKLEIIENLWESQEEQDNFFSIVLEHLPKAPSYEFPLASGVWKDFRVQVAFPPTTEETQILQLRRLSGKSLYEIFSPNDWGVPDEVYSILQEKILKKKENFIVIGPTGSGKTTLLKCLLSEFCTDDRVICLEDTPELPKVNKLSCNLKTFTSSSKEIPNVHLDDLLQASLRLRPDRLIMGEIRGSEASDFLLVLSTGHRGSAATLHANSPHDALRRLEMLSQMGSPWPLNTIRRLIYSSLDFIISVNRTQSGERKIELISELNSLEEEGFLLHNLYKSSSSQVSEAFEF